MKSIVLIFCLLYSFNLSGLVYGIDEPDSIKVYNIPEVVIEQPRTSFFQEDKKVSTPDSILYEIYSGDDISGILSSFTPAYINSTGGTGASSSMFLRGTNSYQTSVKWNGFLLNSLTLGGMDISLVPTSAVQDISVVHGASGSLAGSGNFGGSVLLQNSADWNNRLNISMRTEVGTFDNRHLSFSGKIGNNSLQYQISAFSHDSENDFSYTDIYKSGDPVEKIKNNALRNRGLIQNFFLRLPGNHNVEAGIWYQSREKELPAIMGSHIPGNATQRDSSLRVYARWTKLWARSSFSLNTAMFDENMLYRDKELASDLTYSIDSRIQSRRMMSDMNYRVWVSRVLSLEGGMTFSALTADADTYGKTINENQAAAITAVKLSLPGLTANGSARKEFHSSTQIPFLFSIGAAKDIFPGGLSVKASYSDQFRVPTFNDKYWQPGGNPDLLPESGYTADIGLVQEFDAAGAGFTIEVNAYSSLIRNMIQWVPGENSTFWEPQNRKEVTADGFEASLSSKGAIGLHRFVAGGTFNHARSVITENYSGSRLHEGNRLSYVPSNTASAFLNISSGKAFFGFSGSYTGSRFTGEDNNSLHKMPSFLMLNGYAGFRIRTGDVSGNLRLRIMNLANKQYQMVRSYPMPGRSFHLSFTLEYNNPQ